MCHISLPYGSIDVHACVSASPTLSLAESANGLRDFRKLEQLTQSDVIQSCTSQTLRDALLSGFHLHFLNLAVVFA